jgi:tyrosyl-tRNA synthetase
MDAATGRDREERKRLLHRHTAEVVTEEELDDLLDRPSPSAYVGYAPTGEPHIGHVTTVRKLADFVAAGFDVTVLIADLHAHLDDEKTPYDLLDARSRCYREAIAGMLGAAGVDPGSVEFVRGSAFERDPEYVTAVFRMAATTTLSRARRAGSEVVRERDNPTLGGLLYPLMQTQDVVALDADVAYGGVDQRGIYMFSREVLNEPPVCVFAPLLAGLSGGKMSASEGGAVRVTDDRGTVREKLDAAYCPAGEVADNGVLEYCEHLLFPLIEADGSAITDDAFRVERPDEYGGDVSYADYAALEAAFVDRDLHPQDLKTTAADYVADAIAPVRERLLDGPDLLAAAYPDRHGG